MTPWTEMPEFDGVDLTETYVLGWHLDNEGLHFDLDLALVPGHAAYTPPGLHERTCYRRATLTFPALRAITGLAPQDEVVGAVDASGERDYGNIDRFEEAGGDYSLSGEFGDVHLRSSTLRLELLA
jgi:hypothetical protein